MKVFWWIIVIVVVALLIWFGLRDKEAEVPAGADVEAPAEGEELPPEASVLETVGDGAQADGAAEEPIEE